MRLIPPKGMNDFLPDEMALREAAQTAILSVYTDYGFRRIATPIIEDAENLQNSEGGDNLNLIYQIMKRGDKLTAALDKGEPLWDLGLRYDLTLPLARYYSAHRDKLPAPFKCIQIDRVYRAERPQRGRMREFTQCDIDIMGDDSINAELELIAVTAEALEKLGFDGFTVRINDRRVLYALLKGMGFSQDQLPAACISFDKLDKIGPAKVAEELAERQMPASAVEALAAFLGAGDFSLDCVRKQVGESGEIVNLDRLIGQLHAIAGGRWSAKYDLSLVRGQGYYTGAVFEVVYPGYEGSIAGGGRYDGMVGKFTGMQVPAVGFSIGFERIMSILAEKNARPPQAKPHLALIYAPDAPFSEVFAQIQPLRAQYAVAALPDSGKTGKLLKRLEREGYDFVQLPGQLPRPLKKGD